MAQARRLADALAELIKRRDHPFALRRDLGLESADLAAVLIGVP
jgi:hypothetical protein